MIWGRRASAHRSRNVSSCSVNKAEKCWNKNSFLVALFSSNTWLLKDSIFLVLKTCHLSFEQFQCFDGIGTARKWKTWCWCCIFCRFCSLSSLFVLATFFSFLLFLLPLGPFLSFAFLLIFFGPARFLFVSFSLPLGPVFDPFATFDFQRFLFVLIPLPFLLDCLSSFSTIFVFVLVLSSFLFLGFLPFLIFPLHMVSIPRNGLSHSSSKSAFENFNSLLLCCRPLDEWSVTHVFHLWPKEND